MMRAKDLKEAQQIVDGIAWCDKMLTGALIETQSVYLPVSFPDPDSRAAENVTLPIEARQAAFRLWRSYVERVRAERVRRANQMGLVL